MGRETISDLEHTMASLDLQTSNRTANPKSISVSSTCNHDQVKVGEIPYLPREILLEILKKVPQKNLIRLARVCKLWHSVIFDPDFVKAQLACAQPGIIFRTWGRHYCLDHNPLYNNNILNEGKTDTMMMAEEIQLPSPNQKVIHSCRGLLLLTSIDSRQLYICNPVTRRCKTLPAFAEKSCGRNWSLVYDTSVEKYKVFGISTSNKKKKYFVVMLTLGAAETLDGWRELVTFKSFKVFDVSRIFAVGENELHWLEVEAYEPFRCAVCSLDIAKEESISTILPSYIPPHCFHLMKVRGSICLINKNFLANMNIDDYQYRRPDTLQVWVLEDRVNCKWTQMYNINIPSPPPLSWPSSCPWPSPTCVAMRICTSDSFSDLFKVLLIHENRLFLFDLKSQELRQVAYLNRNETLCQAEYQSHINDSLASWD